MVKPVLIFGGKSFGKVAVEIFKSNQVEIFGILDDDKDLHGTEINDISILGATDDETYLKMLGDNCDAFLAFDDNRLKKSLIGLLNENYKVMPVNAIHKSATLAASAEIHYGSLINMGCCIGANAQIGNHCIVNTGALIDHESKIADYVQIGANSVINCNVTIEEGAFIGSGVTVVSGITIGKNARVGAGSVVIENVKAGSTVFGNPAKAV